MKPSRRSNWLRRKLPFLFPESVFFYTTHKSASTLFSSFVLRQLPGRIPVDYAYAIYSGNLAPTGPLAFHERGYTYGPIRTTVVKTSPVDEFVVRPLVQPEFLCRIRPVVFVRDPRDVLVSQYHSFGLSHPISSVPAIGEAEQRLRDRIRSQTIDAYAIGEAPRLLEAYQTLLDVARLGKESLTLKYEDMVEDFETFSDRLRSRVRLSTRVRNELYRQSRPQAVEDPSAHRRSGKIRTFGQKLAPETVEALNGILHPVLVAFDYKDGKEA